MNQGFTLTSSTTFFSLAEIFAFSSKERDAETGLSYFGARYYSSDLSVWLSVDPMSDEYPSLSPYTYCANNPVKLVDPNGEEYTDFINSETGDCMHIDDGKDQVVIINNSAYNTMANMHQDQYSSMSSSQQSTYNQILAKGNNVDMNSKLGKMIRAVYAEMGNIGSTQEDRNIVAASIATRLGLDRSHNIDNVLVPKQYNAVSTETYENGPYDRENKIAENKPDYYKAHLKELNAIRTGSISAAYKALYGLLPSKYDNIHSYVSPPRSSSYFNSNSRLINVTNSFKNLKGVSGYGK